MLNSFVFFFDSPAKTLNRVMRYEYFGYPKDFLFQYQKAIAAVTRADVLRVAKEHFQPENLTIVAVGNPKEFGKPLTTLGKVNELDLTIPEPKSDKPKSDAAKSDPAAVEAAVETRAAGDGRSGQSSAAMKDVTQSARNDDVAGGGRHEDEAAEPLDRADAIPRRIRCCRSERSSRIRTARRDGCRCRRA